jgi:hypothetical protein
MLLNPINFAMSKARFGGYRARCRNARWIKRNVAMGMPRFVAKAEISVDQNISMRRIHPRSISIAIGPPFMEAAS